MAANQVTLETSAPISVNAEVACKVIQCFLKAEARNKFTDFVVLVDNFKFPCHRFVLSSCSEFFEALLRCDMREKSERQVKVIGISPKIFGLVLDTMYGNLNSLTEDNILEVWHAANQLQIEFLVEICQDFILNSINVKNFWDIYINAECLDSVKVMNAVKTFMVQNFFQVANSDEFMNIYFEDLLGILHDKKLPVCTDFIVESTLKWSNIKFERNKSAKYLQSINERVQIIDTDTRMENRKDHIDKLLQVVNLKDATKECLAMLMTNEDILGNREAIREVNKHVAKDYVTGQKNTNQQKMYPTPLGMYHSVFPHPFVSNVYPRGDSRDANKCPHCIKQPRIIKLKTTTLVG